MNLSQIRRKRMLDFLEKIRELHKDDNNTLIAINEIENELNNKKYGLVWEEHSEKIDEMIVNNIPIFTEDKSKEIISDPLLPYNFLIEGDNLHSLMLLEKTHKGKIDVIYIDPPYNTGNEDFKYDDNFVTKEDSYKHSKWLSFMYSRLKIAKQLLSPNGMIFASIDSIEGFQLKLLFDQIFGESSLIADLHVESSFIAGTRRIPAINGSVVKTTEFILGYSNNSNLKPMKNPKYDYIYGFDTHYKLFFDSKKKEMVNFVDFIKSNEYIFDIFKNNELKVSLKNLSNVVLFNEKIKQWLYSAEIATNLYRPAGEITNLTPDEINSIPSNSVIKFNNKNLYKSGNTVIELFRYSDRIGQCDDYFRSFGERSIRGNLWKGFSSDGGNLNKEGGVSFKNGKKPLRLIIQLLDSVIDKKNTNVVILDFFAGSGTTGEAVLELNKQDGGNRKFILCTNNENNICEKVTYQRIKTVITGIKKDGSKYSEGIKANLKYLKTGFISNDELEIQEKILKYIKELIEIENHISISNQEYLIVKSDREADLLENNFSSYPNLKGLYVYSNVLFSNKQKLLFKDLDIKFIPDYFYRDELYKIGEI